ncbi:aminopeptidase y [Diplodia corticola]|uniref:Peptide hydrolase n=1 Tax=Diplodia corticola TaxID=236234 RepID=A0A1J9R076_9PEZI|nr:aminopeptidase y [Diplodia corticola]OJD34032.1 aminopeptidase y [Diplodia corticola]
MTSATMKLVAGVALTWAPFVHATKPWVTSEALQAGITTEGLMENLAKLDTIASENGGNRAFGLPGYAASVDFISSELAKYNATSRTWIQDFPALFNRVESITFRVDNTSYYVYGLTYSPSTTPEGVTAPLVLGPTGDAGCTVEGYADYDVQDKIVLVERGTCPTGGTLAGRIRPAVTAGASNVIIYNNVPTKVTGGTLSAPDPEGYVSSGFINQDDGQALRDRLQAGEALTAHFQQTQTIEEQQTQNVFAETLGGDPHNVVMLGAHLDSVQAGAGINDDGSGTSLILELFAALSRFDVKNKVRFAWWGAEENGLVGSRAYTASVANTTAADDILLYLNFDMVSRGYYGVFDGDGSAHGLAGPPGSAAIEALFVDHLAAQGLNVTPAVFTGGSDYASFMDTLAKPVGGLHTGTGVAQDPCYHQECDTYDNANPTTLTVNAKAAAHVLATLAINGTDLIPKTPSNATASLDRRFWAGESLGGFPWTEAEGERHLGTCGHDV